MRTKAVAGSLDPPQWNTHTHTSGEMCANLGSAVCDRRELASTALSSRAKASGTISNSRALSLIGSPLACSNVHAAQNVIDINKDMDKRSNAT